MHPKEITIKSSLSDLLRLSADDTSFRNCLEQIRWVNDQKCPNCGCTKSYPMKRRREFKGQYKCSNCHQRFTSTVGTMFEGSHISLRKWFIAIYIFSAYKDTVSSHQLARDLGITQTSAWLMLRRIRYALKANAANLGVNELPINSSSAQVMPMAQA